MAKHEAKVMHLMTLYIEHLRQVEGLMLSEHTPAKKIEALQAELSGMKSQLLRIADLLDGKLPKDSPYLPGIIDSSLPMSPVDPAGAEWIRKCLSSDGEQALKAFHLANEQSALPPLTLRH